MKRDSSGTDPRPIFHHHADAGYRDRVVAGETKLRFDVTAEYLLDAVASAFSVAVMHNVLAPGCILFTRVVAVVTMRYCNLALLSPLSLSTCWQVDIIGPHW